MERSAGREGNTGDWRDMVNQIAMYCFTQSPEQWNHHSNNQPEE